MRENFLYLDALSENRRPSARAEAREKRDRPWRSNKEEKEEKQEGKEKPKFSEQAGVLDK